MEKMEHDLLPPGAMLIAGSIADTTYLYLMISLVIGFVLGVPITAYELYMFFKPALYPHERKWTFKIIVPFTVLMLFGAYLAYVLILPITFKVLLWFIIGTGAVPLLAVSEFFRIIAILMLGTGLTFVSPLFLTLLIEAGIVSYQQLSKARRYIYVAFFIVASIVTPDPTPITTMIVFIPWVIIYESVLFVIRRRDKRRILQEQYGAPSLPAINQLISYSWRRS